NQFAPRARGNLAEGEGIEPPVALASARQFSGLVTLPTRPPLSMIWRRRQDSNPFASLRASSAPVLPVRFSKALRCRFRTHLHNPVRERRLELPRPKAAVFRTAVAASFTTRANFGVPTGIRTRTLAHGALNAACMPVPASTRTFSQAQSCRTAPSWSARRIRTPIGLCARCVLSAVRTPVPPRAEIWRTAAELNLRDTRLKDAVQRRG